MAVEWAAEIQPSDEYLRNWRKYFARQDTEHFENKAFEVVKTILLNTKGIFSSERRYQVLESSMDILIKFMKENYTLESKEEENDSLQRQGTIKKEFGNDSNMTIKSEKNQIPEVL